MYGTLEDPSEDSRPLLPDHPRNQRTSSQGPLFSSQGLVSERGGRERVTRRASARAPVLKEILGKPRRRAERQENIRLGNVLESDNLPNSNPNQNSKSFIYTMLNPRSSAWQAVTFKRFITLVIIMDLVAFVISTEPDLTQEQINRSYKWEGVTSSIFLMEYLARLFTVTESKKYGDLGPFSGRMRYAATFPAFLDLAATIPFFLELISGWDLPTLTYLRAFRLLRILKTSGFSEATRATYRVIYYNRQILYVALLICVGLVLVTAILMYYLRPQDPGDSQDFKSLGSTMYLSTLMLTGQGSPEGDLPWYTKGVVLLTGIFSIGMFAIPASMLTWGFEAEAERCARLAYATSKKTSEDTDNDNWSYSSEDYSTDEEYFKIIAGEGGSDDEDEEKRKSFVMADADGSGNLSLTEFLALSRDSAESAAKASTKNEELASHLTLLEKKVDDNSRKLDRVCQLLEAMQQK